MEYAEAMSPTPPTVTDGPSARLRDALGPAALLELTSSAALANYYTHMSTALGIRRTASLPRCELEPLARRVVAA